MRCRLPRFDGLVVCRVPRALRGVNFASAGSLRKHPFFSLPVMFCKEDALEAGGALGRPPSN